MRNPLPHLILSLIKTRSFPPSPYLSPSLYLSLRSLLLQFSLSKISLSFSNNNPLSSMEIGKLLFGPFIFFNSWTTKYPFHRSDLSFHQFLFGYGSSTAHSLGEYDSAQTLAVVSSTIRSSTIFVFVSFFIQICNG